MTSDAMLTARELESTGALDLVLVGRMLRDESGAVVDAIIEFANAPWRVAFGAMDRDPSGERLLASFPAFADRLPVYVRAAETGEALRMTNPMPGDPSRRFAVQIIPDGDRVCVVAHEVTREEALEAALRESEDRFRLAMEASAIGMCLVAPDGRFLTVNPALCAMLGRDAETLTASRWQDLTHPDDLAIDLAHVEDVLDGRIESYRMRKRFLRPDGSVVWGDLSVACVRREDRAVRYFVSQIVDVTAAHEAEEAVRASEERYRSVVDGLDAVISVQDVAAGRWFMSHQTAALFGYPPEQMSEPGFWRSRVVEEDRERVDAVWDDDATLDSYELEYRMRRADGEVIWIDERHRPVKGPDGRAVRWYGVAFDVTARHRAEEALREEAEVERSVFDVLADGILVQDVDGDYVAVNPAARAIVGLGGDSAAGWGLSSPRWEVTHEDGSPFPPEERPATVTLRTGDECRDVVMNLTGPDGRRTCLRVNTQALRDAEGTLTGVVTSLSDITAERELEARLRRSQRLEAIGQLAGGVAHDFNNLLSAITGYGELARESLPEDSPTRSDIDEILRAAGRASGLTRQLLAFSRRQALKPEVVDPSEVVERVAPMLRRLLGENVELSTDGAPDLGRVKVDPGQLEQVIVNLAVNGRDAMPDGGRLSITLENADHADEVGRTDADRLTCPCVRITVSDTGTGMDAATLARIFEPFFTTKEEGKGTGMGLATVFGIIEQSGGRITVASELGAGTAFTIDLPRIDEPAAADVDAHAGTVVATGTETILLVEDEVAVRTVAVRTLTDLGYTVIAAAGPAEALALDEETLASVDLLVSDIVMPGMSGARLADLLEERRPGLRTILVSGSAVDEAAADRIRRPATYFVSKPFTRKRLATAVRGALDGS